MSNAIVVKLTEGNIKHAHIYLARHADFFPQDSIGAASRKKGVGRNLRLHVAGVSDAVETDIAGDKMIFRKRVWCRQFFLAYRLKAGASIVIQKLSEYEYDIYPKHLDDKPPT